MKSSSTANRNVSSHPDVALAWGSEVARKQSANASAVLDTVRMQTWPNPISVPNSAIDAVHDDSIMLPDGTNYQPQVGSLALGSIKGETEYSKGSGNIIPNYLAAQNITPSASVSLHYSSANLGPDGSLIWGGYDQNRVIGNVGRFNISGPDSTLTTDLIDIELGVETGVSPFGGQNFSSLLGLNNSVGPTQLATINPLLPYLFLAPETCSNIAQHLPVTLQPRIGLYTWNTGDPQYQKIINSPAYLAFIFQSSSGSQNPPSIPLSNLTIKLPFKLLNLTLEPPIVPTPQPYFPCYPSTAADGSSRYFLGRAFLQAAFLALNYNQSSFFMAQAPGPDAPSPSIQSMFANDTHIKSAPADGFAKSWANHWTPLNASDVDPTPRQEKSPSLSKGAIAGIVVGIVFAVLLLAGGISLLLHRYRSGQKRTEPKQKGASSISTPTSTTSPQELSGPFEKDATSPFPFVEAGGREILAPQEKEAPPRWEVE